MISVVQSSHKMHKKLALLLQMDCSCNFLSLLSQLLFLFSWTAIDKLQSSNFKVDLENVQTNILMVQLIDIDVKATEFVKRLQEVRNEEIAANVTDKDGKGIVVKISARDWGFCRLVVYIQITDEDTELAIKKISFVIREFEKKYSK